MAGKRRVMRLQCSVQNYAWGRKGWGSAVGRLYALQSKSSPEPDKPYAELWMGTHESGPSFVILDSDSNDVGCGINGAIQDSADNYMGRAVLLKDWISQNPTSLGDKVLQRWGADLPFLFKVLSVQKALSIQAHPDKVLAQQLHQLQPNIYKDANHKPEMAFAITNFEALCGFLSPQELKLVIETVPEIQGVLGESLTNALSNLTKSSEKVVKSTLKAAFTTLMTASTDVIRQALVDLLERLDRVHKERILTPKELLILRLAEQYPGDVGVLSAFFFNHIELEPGQALYLDANEPHAYLSGECLECMATSDNVVRAGLTPKYIDATTLCNMLTYKQGLPEILPGIHVNKYTKRYAPPFDEFEMDSCMLPGGHSTEFVAILGPSILIVLQGSGDLMESHGDFQCHMTLRSGDIFFIAADTNVILTADPSSADLQLYRAGVNSKLLSESHGVDVSH